MPTGWNWHAKIPSQVNCLPASLKCFFAFSIYILSHQRSLELSDIVSGLSDMFEFSKGGDAPIHSHGSRWISHNRQAYRELLIAMEHISCTL